LVLDASSRPKWIDDPYETGQGGVGMMTALPDLGPGAGTSGVGPRGGSECVARSARNTLPNPADDPYSPSECQESRSNQGDQAVDSPSIAHGGRGRRVKWEIPVWSFAMRIFKGGFFAPTLAVLAAFSTPSQGQVIVTNVTELVDAVNNGAPGTSISLAPGIYELPAAIRLKSGMSLIGAGVGQTILRNAPSFAFPPAGWYGDDTNFEFSFRERYLIDLGRDLSNFTVRGMTLAGPGVYGGVHFIACANVTLTDLEFRDFRWSGIRGYIGTNFTITNNRFIDAGGQIVNPDASFGSTGGSMFLTYLSNSLIQNNRMELSGTRADNVYGVKGREFRSVRIANNTIRCGFSIELPFENDFYVDIENNFLSGAVSIPRYAGGILPPTGAQPYTFRIKNNYFGESYSIEGPRNGLIVENNVFNFAAGDDGGNLVSSFDPFSQTPLAPGPATFRNNIIINPGRGVFWSDVVYNNVTFANNHIFANELMPSLYPEGLLSFRGFSPALGGQTTLFSSIFLTSNIVEIRGTPRSFIRYADAYAANISNNLLLNVQDAASVPNPQTGAAYGLLQPLVFNVGVNGEIAVNGQALLVQAGANPASGFVSVHDLYRYSATPTDVNGDGAINAADLALVVANVRSGEKLSMLSGRR
jgi:hypothetical protein